MSLEKSNTAVKQYEFLKGGGEMSEVILAFDWSSSPIGDLAEWPISLRTTLGAVLHSAFPMFLFWGPELVCFYNDAFRPSLGNNAKHPAIGKYGKEVWPEIWDFIGPLIAQVMTNGKAVWFEDQLVPFFRNGKIEDIYWTFSYGPAYSDDGKIAGVLVVCSETTQKVEQARAHRIIEESEARFRTMAESAPFPIGVYIGKELRIELANQAMLDVYGKGLGVIGQSYKSILPELHDQQIFAEIDSVFETGKPFHARNRYVRIEQDGQLQTFYFNYSFTPLFDAEGKVSGVMNTAADVTDLNLAKKKVEENEKNFRNTILKAPVAICILKGPRYVIEIANDRMLELWGKMAAEVMHQPLFEGLPEIQGQGFESLLYNVYHSGEAFSAQDVPVQLLRNGIIRQEYVDFLYEAEIGAGGSVIGVIVVAMQVTEQVKSRKQIEEVVAERTKELAEANRNLQRSNGELRQYAYIASHDLQEPVRKINIYTQILKSSLGDIDDQSENYLSKISRAGARMTNLIRDVLAYSELSRQAPIFMPVDLEAVIDEVKTELELLTEQKGAAIRSQGLPTVEAIPLQMSQLFINLVSNALKFARTDISTVITITSEPEDIYHHIRVSDNGIGFDQEHAEQIFSIFKRLHRKNEYSGTGIGLAMCRKIVENHHGDIYATSEAGAGATFHILIPRQW